MAGAAAKAKENNSVIQWVTYRLADESYAINVMQVQDFLRVSEIAPVPGVGNDDSANYIEGVASRDGKLLPLVDLNTLLTDGEWGELAGL